MPDADEAMETGWYSDAAATFGDRVAGAREALDMTQEDLAKRLGIKLKTLQAWENDITEPRANKLQMLAGVLNVSLMWLLTGEGPGVEPPSEEEMIDPDITAALAEIREIKAHLGRHAEKLGRLEKRLRAAVRTGA